MVYKRLDNFPKGKNCQLCLSSRKDKEALGEIFQTGDIIVHYFCLLLASQIEQKGTDRQGLLGFFARDIKKEIERGSRITCNYCKKKGATVVCYEDNCNLNFHVPCGQDNGSLHQYFLEFKSFCRKHKPRQSVPAEMKRRRDIVCTFCTGKIKFTNATYNNYPLWPPCCKPPAVLVHRSCLQKSAHTSGYYFKCPYCNNKTEFIEGMKVFGIYIPEQEAIWETEREFRDLEERVISCEAVTCKSTRGRQYSYRQRQSKWFLEICTLCGMNGLHRACMSKVIPDGAYECSTCSPVSSKLESRSLGENDNTSGNISEQPPPVVEVPVQPSIAETTTKNGSFPLSCDHDVIVIQSDSESEEVSVEIKPSKKNERKRPIHSMLRRQKRQRLADSADDSSSRSQSVEESDVSVRQINKSTLKPEEGSARDCGKEISCTTVPTDPVVCIDIDDESSSEEVHEEQFIKIFKVTSLATPWDTEIPNEIDNEKEERQDPIILLSDNEGDDHISVSSDSDGESLLSDSGSDLDLNVIPEAQMSFLEHFSCNNISEENRIREEVCTESCKVKKKRRRKRKFFTQVKKRKPINSTPVRQGTANVSNPKISTHKQRVRKDLSTKENLSVIAQNKDAGKTNKTSTYNETEAPTNLAIENIENNVISVIEPVAVSSVSISKTMPSEIVEDRTAFISHTIDDDFQPTKHSSLDSINSALCLDHKLGIDISAPVEASTEKVNETMPIKYTSENHIETSKNLLSTTKISPDIIKTNYNKTIDVSYSDIDLFTGCSSPFQDEPSKFSGVNPEMVSTRKHTSDTDKTNDGNKITNVETNINLYKSGRKPSKAINFPSDSNSKKISTRNKSINFLEPVSNSVVDSTLENALTPENADVVNSHSKKNIIRPQLNIDSESSLSSEANRLNSALELDSNLISDFSKLEDSSVKVNDDIKSFSEKSEITTQLESESRKLLAGITVSDFSNTNLKLQDSMISKENYKIESKTTKKLGLRKSASDVHLETKPSLNKFCDDNEMINPEYKSDSEKSNLVTKDVCNMEIKSCCSILKHRGSSNHESSELLKNSDTADFNIIKDKKSKGSFSCSQISTHKKRMKDISGVDSKVHKSQQSLKDKNVKKRINELCKSNNKQVSSTNNSKKISKKVGLKERIMELKKSKISIPLSALPTHLLKELNTKKHSLNKINCPKNSIVNVTEKTLLLTENASETKSKTNDIICSSINDRNALDNKVTMQNETIVTSTPSKDLVNPLHELTKNDKTSNLTAASPCKSALLSHLSEESYIKNNSLSKINCPENSVANITENTLLLTENATEDKSEANGTICSSINDRNALDKATMQNVTIVTSTPSKDLVNPVLELNKNKTSNLTVASPCKSALLTHLLEESYIKKNSLSKINCPENSVVNITENTLLLTGSKSEDKSEAIETVCSSIKHRNALGKAMILNETIVTSTPLKDLVNPVPELTKNDKTSDLTAPSQCQSNLISSSMTYYLPCKTTCSTCENSIVVMGKRIDSTRPLDLEFLQKAVPQVTEQTCSSDYCVKNNEVPKDLLKNTFPQEVQLNQCEQMKNYVLPEKEGKEIEWDTFQTTHLVDNKLFKPNNPCLESKTSENKALPLCKVEINGITSLEVIEKPLSVEASSASNEIVRSDDFKSSQYTNLPDIVVSAAGCMQDVFHKRDKSSEDKKPGNYINDEGSCSLVKKSSADFKIGLSSEAKVTTYEKQQLKSIKMCFNNQENSNTLFINNSVSPNTSQKIPDGFQNSPKENFSFNIINSTLSSSSEICEETEKKMLPEISDSVLEESCSESYFELNTSFTSHQQGAVNINNYNNCSGHRVDTESKYSDRSYNEDPNISYVGYRSYNVDRNNELNKSVQNFACDNNTEIRQKSFSSKIFEVKICYQKVSSGYVDTKKPPLLSQIETFLPQNGPFFRQYLMRKFFYENEKKVVIFTDFDGFRYARLFEENIPKKIERSVVFESGANLSVYLKILIDHYKPLDRQIVLIICGNGLIYDKDLFHSLQLASNIRNVKLFITTLVSNKLRILNFNKKLKFYSHRYGYKIWDITRINFKIGLVNR